MLKMTIDIIRRMSYYMEVIFLQFQSLQTIFMTQEGYMKNWEMPLIYVDQFSANDYIAACRQFAGLTGTLYWDTYESQWFGLRHVFNPSGDGEYYAAGEQIHSTGGGAYSVTTGASVGQWYETSLYEADNASLIRDGRSYDYSTWFQGSAFRKLSGTFKIYVFAPGQAWIYSSDMDTSGTPTADHNFS